jgi:hypothetical protein
MPPISMSAFDHRIGLEGIRWRAVSSARSSPLMRSLSLRILLHVGDHGLEGGAREDALFAIERRRDQAQILQGSPQLIEDRLGELSKGRFANAIGFAELSQLASEFKDNECALIVTPSTFCPKAASISSKLCALNWP